MTRVKDLNGMVFNRLSVLSRDTNTSEGRARWKCLCECGNMVSVIGKALQNGGTKSCGCLSRDRLLERNVSHGLAKTRQYRIWRGMVDRCMTKSATGYSAYGGVGIKVDARWLCFEKFWEDMEDGYSDKLTLDRLDSSKDYSKENCRWATMSVQAMNRRKRRGCLNTFIGIAYWPNERYSARYCFKGKITHLGMFPTALQAAQAYDDAVEPIIGTRPNGTTKDA